MNTTTKTAHKTDCKMAFGRKDATCPRCQEMLSGAPARRGWGPPVRSLEHGTMLPLSKIAIMLKTGGSF